jgi:hypothetical protein
MGGTLFKSICAGHETEILLLLVILMISIGKGAGLLLVQLAKKFLGKDVVTVNVSAAEDRKAMAGDRKAMAGDRAEMVLDRMVLAGLACAMPENCPKHGEENQRSLQNKQDIEALEAKHHADREMFFKELKGIRKGITCITNGLLAKQIIDPRDLPRDE